MKAALNLMLMALFGALSIGVAAGQQPGSAAEKAAVPARIYEDGPDVVAPQLIPIERAIPDANACTRESDDEVDLSLIVDADGKPHDVTLINPVGTPVERLAQRILEHAGQLLSRACSKGNRWK